MSTLQTKVTKECVHQSYMESAVRQRVYYGLGVRIEHAQPSDQRDMRSNLQRDLP
jgi:hypothetical protein